MGLLSRVPSTPAALLELLNSPSPFCGMGLHAASSTVRGEGPHQTTDQLEMNERFSGGLAGTPLLEMIRLRAEQLWPATGDERVPASAERRNRLIEKAFKDANEGPPSLASIKRALKDTRFMKQRTHLRKRYAKSGGNL